MSDATVDVIARVFSAFNRRDEPGLLALCDPEIEWVPMRASVQGRVYRGHEGIRQALLDVASEFEELRNDPRHSVDLGDVVVVSGRIVAKEREGGLRVDIPGAWLGEVRDGRVAYMQAFPSEESALKAARERE